MLAEVVRHAFPAVAVLEASCLLEAVRGWGWVNQELPQGLRLDPELLRVPSVAQEPLLVPLAGEPEPSQPIRTGHWEERTEQAGLAEE